MRQRDKDILASLDKFKCLTRSQIESLHFKENANPTVTANRVLKRLRQNDYITANTDRAFQEYIYFLNPAPIKTDSQKLDHYLMIAQGYIDLNKYSQVNNYTIEPRIEAADFIPDVTCEWLGKKWFIEYQNSFYTVKQMKAKLDKYVDYYKKGYWNDERILVIGKVNMQFESDEYPFKVKQVKGIDDLKGAIESYKKMSIPVTDYKSNNGTIKFTI